MKHVMVDLETLGNGPNSVVIAIGAVKFNTQGIEDKFYVIVDPQSCIDIGLEMDASTVMWWMQQSDEARSAFKQKGVSINKALLSFSNWIGGEGERSVWGNGASFDNVILSSAYKKAGLQQPWGFWEDRCYRTIKSLYQDIKLARTGTYHCAVDDAQSQAEHLIQIAKVKGIPL